MNRAKFLSTMRLWAVCILVLSAFCLAGNIQRAYAETYTTMDSSGNLITSDSLESAIETARITGRPIALDPGHSDGMSGRDPGAIGPSGLREGDVAWSTAMSTKYYLEKWGIKVVVVRGQNEDPTLKERVQRAVDAKCCAIVSMHYNSAGPNAVGSMVLTPRNIRYNNDLYTAGQKLAKAINGELNKRAGITTRWDSAPTKGYGGGDTYDTGEESDYFGIIRYARRNGILGVIIEHEFISNPSMEAKLSNSAFIDRIGYADAWGIWDHFYASKTWWSMSRVDAWSGSDGQITMRPHLVGVGSGMTYSYYYKISGGSWVTLAENTTNTSYSFTPLSGGTYTLYITAKSSDGTSVSRQIEYKAGTIQQSPGWHKTDNGWMYFNSNGEAYSSRWFKDSDGWHFFNAAGIAARGWAYTTNNDIFYFDPSQEHHPALLGEVTLNGGRHYYFDEHSGLAQDRWVKLPGGNWVYASKEGAFISGWHYIGGNKIFYFDTEDPTHPALFGEVVLNGGRHYWFDENQGMASNQWVETKPGSKSFASKEGAFVSGWHYTTGGKLFYFDEEQPDHPVKLGEVALDGHYYWFDKTEGLARKQWVTLPNGDKAWATQEGSLTGRIINGEFFAADGSQPTGKVDLGDIVVYVSEDHKLLTGWQKIDGKDYFFNDDGRPASGWLNYGGSWYFLDSNGLMQTGWVHPSGSYWYHLAANGKMDTGWIKDGGKDYYLDPTSGAMKTGYLSWGGKLYHADSDGAMYEAPCYYPDMLRYAQNIYSATRWLIQIDTHQNRFAVYYGSYGNWVPWHEWYCTTGAPGMWTPHGQFSAGMKGLYFGSGYRCWYYTQISGDYLIHSILYNSDGYTVRDGRLGYHGSHGCVRLATENAKWVYNNIPYGTKIYIW